ncbi:MAG: dihydroorotase [Planctomycetota bacterium]
MTSPQSGDLLLQGGLVHTGGNLHQVDVLVEGGRITAIGHDLVAPAGCPTLDCHGKWVLPGLIDPQVHFREPGLVHKEDLESGSRAALWGGITAFMEMPNTKPMTTDPAALEDKLRRADDHAWVDYAFFLGATSENADRLGEWESLPGCAGVKVFMGSSTGDLLVRDDATLERILRGGTRRVTVHSEDDFRLSQRYSDLAATAKVTEHDHIRDVTCAVQSTTRLLDLVEKTGRPVHILHVSTADELRLVRERDLGDLVTLEATPNHLFLCAPQCYEEHGSHAQMNPPVRGREHQEALRQACREGLITCIGSDHAPHTAEEKAKPYPNSPSGIPGTQTILPLLLTAIRDGWLELADILRLCHSGPVHVYGIADRDPIAPGATGTFTLVDPAVRGPLELSWLQSRVGWSPFAGRELAGLPWATILRGQIAHQLGAEHERVAIAPLRFGTR